MGQHHNSKKNRLWSMGVNYLSDYTEVELSQLRGLRPIRASKKTETVESADAQFWSQPSVNAKFLSQPSVDAQLLSQPTNASLPDAVSWSHLASIQADTNQLQCGSCWAVATAT